MSKIVDQIMTLKDSEIQTIQQLYFTGPITTVGTGWGTVMRPLLDRKFVELFEGQLFLTTEGHRFAITSLAMPEQKLAWSQRAHAGRH